MAPTSLSPWYVVYRDRLTEGLNPVFKVEYYTSVNDPGEPDFTTIKNIATLFPTFQSAMRIAEATGADVRVIWNKDHVKEFGR